MTSCAEREPRLALHIAGDLTPHEAAEVQAHVEACSTCRQFLAEMRRSQSALQRLRAEEVDAAVYAGMRSRVLAALPVRGTATSASHWTWTAPMAAGLLLALGAGLILRGSSATSGGAGPASEARSAIRAAAPERPRATPSAELRSTHSTPPADVEVPRRKAAARQLARVRALPGRFAQAAATAPAKKSGKTEPTVIKLLTDDPDIVIYWVLDENGGEP